MTPNRVFRSLSWGYHAPGGCVLWWLIQPTKHLHILRVYPFDQMDEQELAAELKKQDRELGIGVDTDGFLLKLAVQAIAYTVGTPEIVSDAKKRKAGYRGETVGDRLLKCGIVVIPADDDERNGFARCLSLLTSDPDGKPWLTVEPDSKQLIQSFKASLLDEKHEDLIVNESPAMKAFRYGAMSRPSPRTMPEPIIIPPGSPRDVMNRLQAGRDGRRFGQAR